jgi:hypothetical protein
MGTGAVDCDAWMVLTSCRDAVSYILIWPWLVPASSRDVVVNASVVTLVLLYG